MPGIAFEERGAERPFVRGAGGAQLIRGGSERERDAAGVHVSLRCDDWPAECGADPFDAAAPGLAQRIVDLDAHDFERDTSRRQARVLARKVPRIPVRQWQRDGQAAPSAARSGLVPCATEYRSIVEVNPTTHWIVPHGSTARRPDDKASGVRRNTSSPGSSSVCVRVNAPVTWPVAMRTCLPAGRSRL